MNLNLLQGYLERNKFFLAKLAIITAVLLLSVYLGRRGSRMYVVMIACGIAALAFLRWPLLGLFTLLTGALLIPFSIGTGTQTDLNIVILLLPVLIGLWFLDMLVIQRSITLRPMRVVLPLLLLCLVALLALLAGQLPWFDAIPKAPLRAQLGGLALFWLSAGAFLLVAHQIRDLRWLEWLTWTFIALGSIYVLARMLPLFGPRISGLFPLGATGSLFWIWLVALSLGQAIFNMKLDRRIRILLVLLVIGAFYVTFIRSRDWASGWLPAAIAMLTIITLWKPRLGISIFIIIVIIFVLRFESIVSAVFSLEEYSYITRMAAWEIVIDLIKVNPVLGLGPANYYFYTPLYSLMGYFVSFNSHNQSLCTVFAPVMEPFGLVPLESMACGTPVVGICEGGVRETVVDGVTGFLEQRDPEQFARAILRLVEDQQLSERLGQQGRDFVEKQWTWERAIQSLEEHMEATVDHARRT